MAQPAGQLFITDETYKIPVVSCVLFDKTNNSILVQKRIKPDHEKDMYCFPGGKIRKDETVEEAFIRELKEETDLDVDPKTTLDLMGHCSVDQYVILFMLCTTWTGVLTNLEPEKISEYRWIKPSTELYKLPLTKGMEIFNGSVLFFKFMEMVKTGDY